MRIAPVSRFGATLRFVSQATIASALEQAKADNRHLDHWGIGPTQFYPGNRATTAIACCLGGGLANGNDAAVVHLLPTSHHAQRVNTHLLPLFNQGRQKLRKTKHPQRPWSSLLIGAHSHDLDRATHLLLKRLKQLFRNAGMPLSVFALHPRSGHADVVYTPENDTWLISLNAATPSPVQSIDDLKQRYQHVSIAPTDTVEFEEAHASSLRG